MKTKDTHIQEALEFIDSFKEFLTNTNRSSEARQVAAAAVGLKFGAMLMALGDVICEEDKKRKARIPSVRISEKIRH